MYIFQHEEMRGEANVHTAVSPVKTFYNNSLYRWLKANLGDIASQVNWFKVTFQQENNKITETYYNLIMKPYSYVTDIFIHPSCF